MFAKVLLFITFICQHSARQGKEKRKSKEDAAPDRHIHTDASPSLLQRDEAGGVGGTDTRTTVLDGLVRDGELTEVSADHLGLERARRSNQKTYPVRRKDKTNPK